MVIKYTLTDLKLHIQHIATFNIKFRNKALYDLVYF